MKIGIPKEIRGSGAAVVSRTIAPAVEAHGVKRGRRGLRVDFSQHAVNNGCTVLDLSGRERSCGRSNGQCHYENNGEDQRKCLFHSGVFSFLKKHFLA